MLDVLFLLARYMKKDGKIKCPINEHERVNLDVICRELKTLNNVSRAPGSRGAENSEHVFSTWRKENVEL